MADPIKYTDVYLYTTDNSASSSMKEHLDSLNIDYIQLNYGEPIGAQGTLEAISTWFDDPNDSESKVQFTEYPFVIFEKVYWEAADGSEKMQKRDFAKSVDGLPNNFKDLAPKK